MDGRVPITKAKSSHYCARKRETLMLCKIRFLQSISANRLRCDWNHLQVLSVPSKPLGGSPRVGSFGLPPRSHTAVCFAVPRRVPAASENPAAAPTASASCHPSFGFPCFHLPVPSSLCILCRFPHHRLLSWFQRPARPTYHSPLPAEPGNLTPAHPACSFPPANSKFPYQTPYPYSHPPLLLLLPMPATQPSFP